MSAALQAETRLMIDEVALTKLLSRHVPDVLAASMLRRAREAAAKDPKRLLDEIRTSIRLFVDVHKQRPLLLALEDLSNTRLDFTPDRIAVVQEADVSRARLRAREMSQQLGGSAFGAQRASTAVSELARNIVMYAGSGEVVLVPRGGVPPTLIVRATDSGTGIPDLRTVLSGTYKSSTGLGRGLLGVKRLAARFNVQTGRNGTTVEAEISL